MDMERAPAPKGPVPPSVAELNLPPGFRFHPTDEELMVHYLSRKATPSHPYGAPIPIIAEVDLYKFDPWELPQQASFGEKEWYFFSPRERKYPNGARPNRAAASGYWKATGTDKPICSSLDGRKVGVKKALVFYKGRAPRGIKTNWIMHEYRLVDSPHKPRRKGSRLDDWVLCRIYKKKTKSHRSTVSKAEGKRGAAAATLQHSATVNEDVLASLPDIDNSKISTLPRLGSLNDAFVQTLLAADPARAPTSNNSNNSLGQFGNLEMMDRERIYTSNMLGQATRNNEQLLLLQQFAAANNGLHSDSLQQMPVMNDVPARAAHNFFSDNSSSSATNNNNSGSNKAQLTFAPQFSSPQYSPAFLDYSNSFQFFST